LDYQRTPQQALGLHNTGMDLREEEVGQEQAGEAQSRKIGIQTEAAAFGKQQLNSSVGVGSNASTWTWA